MISSDLKFAKGLAEPGLRPHLWTQLDDVFGNTDLAIGTFRRSISIVIPEMTRVALLARKQAIVRDTPNFNKKKFLYYLSRKQYEKQWGTTYRKPGFGTRMLAFFLRHRPEGGTVQRPCVQDPDAANRKICTSRASTERWRTIANCSITHVFGI